MDYFDNILFSALKMLLKEDFTLSLSMRQSLSQTQWSPTMVAAVAVRNDINKYCQNFFLSFHSVWAISSELVFNRFVLVMNFVTPLLPQELLKFSRQLDGDILMKEIVFCSLCLFAQHCMSRGQVKGQYLGKHGKEHRGLNKVTRERKGLLCAHQVL